MLFKLLKNIFRKKNVHFLGRGGLIFDYHDNEYIIDSEMSFVEPIDLVIFKDQIRYKDRSKVLTEGHKKEVLEALLACLKNEEHLRVEVHPA